MSLDTGGDIHEIDNIVSQSIVMDSLDGPIDQIRDIKSGTGDMRFGGFRLQSQQVKQRRDI